MQRPIDVAMPKPEALDKEAVTVTAYQMLADGMHYLIHQKSNDPKSTMIPLEEIPSSVEYQEVSVCTNNNTSWNVTSNLGNDFNSVDELHQDPDPGVSSCKDDMSLDNFGEIVMSFKCRICAFLSVDRNELKQHFENRHIQANEHLKEEVDEVVISASEDDPNESPEKNPTMIYLCGQCNQVLESLEECRHHMMDSHELIMASSEDDDNSQTETTVQTQDTKGNVKFKCNARGCLFKFSSEEILNVHSQCHLNIGKSYQCYKCSEIFARWRPCAMHLWKCHSIDPGLFACPICHEYKTFTLIKLQMHIKTHGEARPYHCPHIGCGKSFKQPSQLRNHRVLHLDRKTVEVPRWYSSQKCDICSKTLADSKCLKKHIQAVHSKLRPYKCNVCGHASARKAMLQMHHRQHTGEKPYNCDQCAFKTGDHNSLRRHKMRHTGFRPYQCPHCPYASIQSNSYKNHIRNKHPGMHGSYNCVDCGFRTVNEDIYLAHGKDHANGVIPPTVAGCDSQDYFPENEMAANMIYHCLNGDSNKWRSNVTGRNKSADGLSETITIQLPGVVVDDEEAQCFLVPQLDEEEEEEVDTGGITIPADPE